MRRSLLTVYNGGTVVLLPKIVRPLLGVTLDLGLFYKVYMSLLAIFCTNSINIYAGINGLEVGQTIVIGCSLLLHNVLEISRAGKGEETIYYHHLFSATLLVPFLMTSLALLRFNS